MSVASIAKPVVYVIGSLRNLEIPHIGHKLRGAGFEAFDDWWSASEDADDWLRDYYKGRGFDYRQTLKSYAAKHIFDFDLHHLQRADIGLLCMPAGKSGHLELGFMRGLGKPCYVLFDTVPERVDLMYQFADEVFFYVEDLVEHLKTRFIR